MRSSVALLVWSFSLVSVVGACGKKDAPAEGTAPGVSATGQDAQPAGPAGLLDKSPADDWPSDGGTVKVLVHRSEAREAAGGVRIVIELDVLDTASGKPIPQLDPDAIALTLDGKYVPGKYQVQTARDAGRGVALALLLPAHMSYATGPDAEQGLEINPLEEVKRGATAILQKLTDNDRVAVFGLTEEGLRALALWGPPSGAIASVASLGPLAEPRNVPPPLYSSIGKVLDSIAESAHDLPTRRVVLTVSDGLDVVLDKPSLLEKRMLATAERALSPEVGADIWALGFTLGEDAPLTTLETLVFKTRGRYRKQAVESHKELAAAFEALGVEATQGFVVTVIPDAGVRLPTSPIDVLELAVRVPTSGAVGRARDYGVKLAPL